MVALCRRAGLAVSLTAIAACGVAPTAPTAGCPAGADVLIGGAIRHPPASSVVQIRPAEAILGDPEALAAHREAAAEASALTGLRFYVEEDPRAELASGPRVFTHVDAGLQWAAQEVDQPNGDAAISFQAMWRARRKQLLLHELLHFVGLKGHSPIPSEIMCGDGGCDPNRAPSARERAVIAWLMRQPDGPLPAACTAP